MVRRLARAAVPYLFLLPNFLGFVLFSAGPVLAVFAMALCDGDFLTRWGPEGLSVRARWVGLANFERLIGDRDFWSALWNTLVLLLAIPIGMAGSLGLALLLRRRLRGVVVFRTAYFLPTISAGVALFLIWRWIYNPDLGLANRVLHVVGIRGPDWLSDAAWAKPALIIMNLWIGLGGTNMVLYLAALSEIDPSLYEAAALDGASRGQVFRNVTWPLIMPTTFFILTTNLIGGFQIFDQAYVMTGGGPNGATTTVMYYVYQHLYVYGHVGYAAALAVALFVVVFVVTLGQWRLMRGRVHS